jgi:hypothetical protein
VEENYGIYKLYKYIRESNVSVCYLQMFCKARKRVFIDINSFESYNLHNGIVKNELITDFKFNINKLYKQNQEVLQIMR